MARKQMLRQVSSFCTTMDRMVADESPKSRAPAQLRVKLLLQLAFLLQVVGWVVYGLPSPLSLCPKATGSWPSSWVILLLVKRECTAWGLGMALGQSTERMDS